MRQDFIRELAAIRYDTSLPVFFVLSLRDDYFVKLNEFREAIPSIFYNSANIQLRPLDDAATERAIVNPARDAGCEIEEGLPQRIIDDLKPLNPDGNGVLPITLQIVCHNLWMAKGAEENRITAAQYNQLGGARKIVDQHFERSLAQIPRRHSRLMRRLFRLLITADLPKRLRSADDFAELLGLRPSKKFLQSCLFVWQLPTFARAMTIGHRRLESLLGGLTVAGIFRTEQRRGAAWYEFRHDYLARYVASWVNRVEGWVRIREPHSHPDSHLACAAVVRLGHDRFRHICSFAGGRWQASDA